MSLGDDLLKTAAEHRRLSILRVLAEVGGTTNESILQTALETLGLQAGLTRQKVRDDLRFLEDAGAVKIEWVGGSLAVATITLRGCEIEKGREIIPGIKRPSLGV